MSENPEEKLHSLTTEDAFHRFSLADIQIATQNFDEALVIGKGGFGTVYKGRIHGTRDATERLVAIKRLDSSSTQGAPEFMNEIKMLTKVQHCNLVSLIGYCFNNNEMILVYEYMPNGTIDYHLHKADTRLSWMHRLKISIGVARGLHYLHTGVGTQHGIIHRDLKSSNILLDENWAARISDFGMSKIVDHPSSGVITTPKGTFGYLDHEYCRTGKLTRKSDVYAFGVFLFELLSGRRAVDPLFVDEGHNVADWAKKCIKEGQLEQVVSSHITKQISPKCLKEFVHIADLCTKSSRKERPTMAEVVYTLDQLMALQKKFDSSGSRHNSGSLRIFSYSDMEVATKNFSSHRLLGRGNCGELFRGWLDKKTHSSYIHDNGLSIAVKRLYRHKFKSHMVNEVFEYFASYRSPTGEPFMTPADLMRAVVPVFPPSDATRILEGCLKGEWSPTDLHCAPSKFFMLFDTNNDGLISFAEYIFFVTLLSIPESSFLIAFKMFDLDNSGEIDKEEFKKVMAMMRAQHRQGSRQRGGMRNGLKISTPVENGGLLEYFLGKDGKTCLALEKFVRFLKDLNNEILLLEFAHYNHKSIGTISAKDFALSMVASADMIHFNKFLGQVDQIDDEPNLNNIRISFDDFKKFAELRTQLKPLTLAIFSYGKVNGLLTKKDFQRATKQVCGISLSDEVIDIIYFLFDENRDGRLSSDEFLQVLQRREEDKFEPRAVGLMGIFSCWLQCSRNNCSTTRILF